MCEHVASRLFARFVPYLSFHGGWVFLLVHCEQHSVNLNAKTSVVDRTGDIRDEDRRWHVRYCNLKNLERSHSMGTAVAGKGQDIVLQSQPVTDNSSCHILNQSAIDRARPIVASWGFSRLFFALGLHALVCRL
ncbi:uncharacterized protein [Montipora capricornis]|uniref:uncharacterized protein isoform X1 n=1 Tax=Montipora capricornis TaxID=246305 RepID=UPI0035F20FB7